MPAAVRRNWYAHHCPSVAENVGDLIRWSNEGDKAGKGYKISSVGAIDLFPQTHHTEGLLVLTRDV